MLAQENFAAWIFKQHADKGQQLAIVDHDTELTYSQLEQHTVRFAGYLCSRGFLPQQRIIVSMDDCASWPVVFLGCLYAGLNPVMVSDKMLPNDVEKIIKTSDAVAIVSDHIQDWSIPCINKNFALNCASAPLQDFYRFHPDEPCFWLLSSGSTGESKCIVNRHANLYHLFKLFSTVFQVDSSTAILSTAKMSWTYGLNTTITLALGMGATAHVIPGLPAPSKIADRVSKHNITHLFTVPGILVSMLKHKTSLTNTKLKVYSAGESLPTAVTEQFLDTYGIKVYNMFGLGETTQVCIMQTDANWQVGTIGQPLEGVNYELRDDQGCLVEPGQIGELFVSSPCQASFYWKDWKKTQQVFYGPWIKTGDKCRYNSQGNLEYLGRCDDLVKIKGQTVVPVEVETVFSNFPGVEDCTVVHGSNASGLAELHAFVQCSDPVDLELLQQHLKKYLAEYKIPKHIRFVSSLPKTLTNKKIRQTVTQHGNGIANSLTFPKECV
jgi:benzoate-CoA ligase